MRRFSHWENVDRRTFWGWHRDFSPVYVEERDAYHIVVRCAVVQRDPELVRIERETLRLHAFKQQLDAEAEMLDSCVKVARKQTELRGLLQITRQKQDAGHQKLIPYRPEPAMTKVR